MKKPMTLIIMDGFGLNPSDYGNAIHAAHTPNLTRLFAENPCTRVFRCPATAPLPSDGFDLSAKFLSRVLRGVRINGVGVGS